MTMILPEFSPLGPSFMVISGNWGISWQFMFNLMMYCIYLEVYHDIFSEWNWLSRLTTILESGTTPNSDHPQQSPMSLIVRKCKKYFAWSNLALLKRGRKLFCKFFALTFDSLLVHRRESREEGVSPWKESSCIKLFKTLIPFLISIIDHSSYLEPKLAAHKQM